MGILSCFFAFNYLLFLCFLIIFDILKQIIVEQTIYSLYVIHITYVIYFFLLNNGRKLLYIWRTRFLYNPTFVSVGLYRSQIPYEAFVQRVHNEHGPLHNLIAFALFLF